METYDPDFSHLWNKCFKSVLMNCIGFFISNYSIFIYVVKIKKCKSFIVSTGWLILNLDFWRAPSGIIIELGKTKRGKRNNVDSIFHPFTVNFSLAMPAQPHLNISRMKYEKKKCKRYSYANIVEAEMKLGMKHIYIEIYWIKIFICYAVVEARRCDV